MYNLALHCGHLKFFSWPVHCCDVLSHWRHLYAVGLQLVVPDAYPSESPTLEITSSNFSKDVSSMFEMQARELIRRMKEGYSPAAAMAEEANKLLVDC